MVVSELYCLRFGPIELPLFTVILHLIYAYPGTRAEFLKLAEFLAKDCKVPVDAVDLAGSSALMHACNTKPYYDEQFAEIMRRANAKINRQDRLGKTAAHYIANMDVAAGPAADRRATDAMRYFIMNGGDTAIADGEGVSVVSCAVKIKQAAPMLSNLLLGKPQANHAGVERNMRTLSIQAQQYANSLNKNGIPPSNGVKISSSSPVANANRPNLARAVSNNSVISKASSGGSMGGAVGSMKINLPGVTCPCQRRGMWRICCGKPPDLEAMRKALV